MLEAAMTRTRKSAGLALFALFPLALALASSGPAKDDWPPIPPEDLAMKDNPASPGAHAMILNQEQVINETNPLEVVETDYVRIKIFTEQGKKFADIEIPFLKNEGQVNDIQARTVHPDGKVIPFDGQVFEQTVIKYRDLKFLAKTFTLPDVQPGSIIEYRYRVDGWSYSSLFGRWTLQEDLYMRHASFTLRPYTAIPLHWSGKTMHGEKLQVDLGVVRLEVNNTPGFEKEDYTPPEEELKPHLDYYHSSQTLETPEEFWKRVGKDWNDRFEHFIGNHGEVRDAAAQAVDANDPPETRLRKLYARSQQIRNLSFEREKSVQEEKRENLKENKNVADVLKHGYSGGFGIDLLFAALARASGFPASIVRVSRRNQYFFNRQLENPRQLNDIVVEVMLGSSPVYLDPGTVLCPYGLLPWAETDVAGLRLDRNGGTFIITPHPESSQAVIRRKADLQLSEEGDLEGKLLVEYSGLEALRRRLDARDEDEAGRKKFIEDEAKEWLPAGAKFELSSVSGWEDPQQPLRFEAKVNLPGFAASAGRRILLPVTIFQSNMPASFQRTTRFFPIYFSYPSETHDAIAVHLPDGFKVETLPDAKEVAPRKDITYHLSARQQGQTIEIERSLVLNGLFFPATAYPPLRAFFSAAKTNDEQQAVLQHAESAQSH
jgi:hypothetical protein